MKLTTKPKSARQLAEQFGVCKLTVYRWISKQLDEGVPVQTKKVRDGKTGPLSKGYFIAKEDQGKAVRNG